jgi:DNA mismatch repair protein MutL
LAAVADLTIDSRPPSMATGMRLETRPGWPPVLEPVGMPKGTRIEVVRLFGNVPARRKFMRSEATEVGHCSETLLCLALVHPGVHLRLRHGDRELFDVPAATLPERIAWVLERRGTGPLHYVDGVHDDVRVEAWLGGPDAAIRSKHGLFVVVRRRVVRERSLARIVRAAYGETLSPDRHPLACLRVEPPTGEVDVNVHPQKAEIRFGDPQRVYTAVRQILADTAGHWKTPDPARSTVRTFGAQTLAALDGWSERSQPDAPASGSAPYRLHTKAAEAGYAAHRSERRDDVSAFRARQHAAECPPPSEPPQSAAPVEPRLDLLTCMPGPVALLRHEDTLLAVDLRVLRTHLVHRRLVEDLGQGTLAAQGLLQPVLVRRSAAEVRMCLEATEALAALGVVVESFGDDTLRVRAVPASLRACIDDLDVADLLDRILPWLRVRVAQRRAPSADALVDAVSAMAQAAAPDPAPRLARRWVRELLQTGVDLANVPGIRRWSGPDLCR